MATLHLLSHSPFSDGRLASCLQLLSNGDGLLLTGDAVYALTAGTSQQQALEALPLDVELYALQEDVYARAIHPLPSRLKQVDYAEFVELCCHYARTNTWL